MAELFIKTEFVQPQLAYMTLTEIRRGDPGKPNGVVLGGAYGFTEPNFDFPDTFMKDMRQVNSSPAQWKFEGTSLTLRVRPVMTLPSEYKQKPHVMEVITQHEKLHVHDAQEIIRGPLQHRLKSDAMFKEYFIDRALIPDVTYRHMFPKQIKEYVLAIFTELWNAKVSERDSPAKYGPVEYAVGVALRRY